MGKRLQPRYAAEMAARGRLVAYFAASEASRKEIADKVEAELSRAGVAVVRTQSGNSTKIDTPSGSVSVNGPDVHYGLVPTHAWLNEADL